jgi:hypothetical protein
MSDLPPVAWNGRISLGFAASRTQRDCLRRRRHGIARVNEIGSRGDESHSSVRAVGKPLPATIESHPEMTFLKFTHG